ncbi:MAG: hypothetical protein IJ822_03785 [Pyramidobacter sp.]|nr:hypothetical protein [Pyramidobacter sp.]MBQ8129380.1 hypothetical protein [Clostridia bacterium]MBR1895882.1 hypothetical protein [Pyramidobacter sp.]
MREELLMFAVWDADRHRWFIDVRDASLWPLPDGAVPVCRIDREDRELMMEQAVQLAKAGCAPAAIRRVLEG